MRKKMARYRSDRAEGFTFIEVLVALAIASIALVGLLKLHLVSMDTADVAGELTQAVFIAQQCITEASATDYPRQGTQSGVVEQNGIEFTWRTEVTDATDSEIRNLALKNLRQVRTTVSWRRGAERKSTQVTTYVADPRIHD